MLFLEIRAKVERVERNQGENKNCLPKFRNFSKPSHMEITVQDLHKKLESGEPFVFIDVREPWEYEEFNLGAQLIPLNTLVNSMYELEDHKEDQIILHCRSGARSGMAQGLMLANGFKNVLNLQGGILAWEAAFGKTKL